MKQIPAWLLRGALLVLVAAIVPACTHDEDDDDDSPPPAQNPPPNPPPPNTVTLFEEKFDGAFPGSSWTDPAANGAGPTATVSTGEGNPAPSLQMTTSAGPDPLATTYLFLTTDTTTTFSDGPLTASVDLKALAAGEGSGAIAILDATNTPVAAAEWHPTDSFGAVTFMINGTAVSVPPPPPGSYHALKFSRDAGGTASWSMDGGAPAMTQAVPAGPYTVRLYLMVASPTGPFATFHFDNVRVTTP